MAVTSPNPSRQAPDRYPVRGAFHDRQGDTQRLIHSILEKAWVLVLFLIVFVSLGALYIQRAPVLYSSAATIQVEQDRPVIFTSDAGQMKDLQALDFLQTVAQSLKARPLLERVAASNNLANDRRFSATATNGMQVVSQLEQIIGVKLRRGTRLIDINVTHSSPVLAEKIANSLVGEFTTENAERHVTSAEVANEALLKEADRLQRKLQESENALQAYKEKFKASSLDDRQNTVVAELKELSARVTEAKSVRIQAESDYKQLQQLGTNVEAMLTLPAIASDAGVVSSKINLSRAENEFANIRQRYKEMHPRYVQAMTQITAFQQELHEMVLRASRTIYANLERSRASEEALTQELRAQEGSALELNKLAIQYSVLAREVESDRALYDSVLKGMKETNVKKEMNPVRVRVVQPAYRAERPVSPKKAMILAMSGMGGIFAGLVVVLGLGFLDSSIKTVDEAEMILSLPVLSTIFKAKEVKRGKCPLIVLNDAKSSGAESFRTLRTSLSMLGREQDRRVFLFTSSLPQEGKTFCSINYAASLAQLGFKTLLIDGDLRRPTVESYLAGKEGDHPGVTNYLTSQKALSDVVQPTKQEGLFFIAGGSTAPNPAELLAKDGLSALITDALQTYDRVVVDSAPVHAVSDTLLMMKSVQTVCLVIRAAGTPSRSVLRCMQLLNAAGAPLSGVILNLMPVRRSFGYGYYNYGPYYDYNYKGKYSKKGVYGT